MSLPLFVKSTSASARGLDRLTSTSPVDTRAKTGMAMLAPEFCLKTILDVTVSGKTLPAARPVVLPASAGINAANLAQRFWTCPG